MKDLVLLFLILSVTVVQAQHWDKTVNDDYQSNIFTVHSLGSGEYMTGGYLLSFGNPLFSQYNHSNSIVTKQSGAALSFVPNDIVENSGYRYVVGKEWCVDVPTMESYVAKLDQSGALHWTKTYQHSTNGYFLEKVAIDDSLNLYIVFDKEIWKLDSSGQVQWQLTDTTGQTSKITHVARHSSGLMYFSLSISGLNSVNLIDQAGQIKASKILQGTAITDLHTINDSTYVMTDGKYVYVLDDHLAVLDSTDVSIFDMNIAKLTSNDTAIFFTGFSTLDNTQYAGGLSYDLSLAGRVELPSHLQVWDITTDSDELVIAGATGNNVNGIMVNHGFIKGVPTTFAEDTIIYDIAVARVENSKITYVPSGSHIFTAEIESKVWVKNTGNVAVDSLWLQAPTFMSQYCNTPADKQVFYDNLALQPGDSVELVFDSEYLIGPPTQINDSVKFTYSIMASRPNSRVETDIDNNYMSVQIADIVTEIESANAEQNTELLIYPNPADGALGISFSAPITGNLHLLNMLGQSVMNISMQNEAVKQFDIAHLPAGMYLIRINTGGQVMTKQVLKK